MLLLFLGFVLIVFWGNVSFRELYSYIDFDVLGILLVMMILTTALEISGFFGLFAFRLVSRVKNLKFLAFVLVFLAIFLATILTNDITLFVIIPVAKFYEKFFKEKFWLLISMLLISVNIGSMLTPFGNPQNMIIWRKWDIDLIVFVRSVLPFFAAMLLLIFSFVFLLFENKSIALKSADFPLNTETDKTLAWLSLGLFVLFVIAIELDVDQFFIPAVFVFYFFYKPEVFKKADWKLMLLFLLVFIDFNFLSINILSGFVVPQNNFQVFFWSVGLSQLISNVPATVVLVNHTGEWLYLLLGVNLGAQGFFLGSLANIIGFRLAKQKNLGLKYHLVSLPFLIVSVLLVYLMLFVLGIK